MTPSPPRYRWLTQGQRYVYQPKAGKGDDSRRLSLCHVLTLPRPGAKPANVAVQFADGHTAVVPAGVLKKEKA